MAFMSLVDAVAWCGLIVTLILFFSGIPFCLNIIRTKSTKNVPYLQFLLTGVNNLGFLYYGYLINDSFILSINTIGVLLQVVYVFVYIIYHQPKSMPVGQLLFATLACSTLYFYLETLTSRQTQEQHAGLVASSLTTVMACSPITFIVETTKTKDVGCINLPLTILGLLCGSLWLWYGALLGDVFVMAPSIPGIPINIVCLYMIHKYSGATIVSQDKKIS